MVSGQGKWQEWMPKLERSRLDLRKPCYPQHASIPRSEEHGSESHPGNVWSRRVGRAPLRGGFSEPQKPQDTWEDSSLSITASAVYCVPWDTLSVRQCVIVAHTDEYAPRSREIFWSACSDSVGLVSFSPEKCILSSNSNSFNHTINSTGIVAFSLSVFL